MVRQRGREGAGDVATEANMFQHLQVKALLRCDVLWQKKKKPCRLANIETKDLRCSDVRLRLFRFSTVLAAHDIESEFDSV